MHKRIKGFVLSLLFISQASFALTHSLVFASDLIRHGARTPIHPLSTIHYPALWSTINIPTGQLTQFGFYQERLKGRYFKNEYEKLLPLAYSADNICIRSTGSNRTIMSAIAVMSMIYPQQISYDIQSVPKRSDHLLQPQKGFNNIVSIAPGWKEKWQDSQLGYPLFHTLYNKGLINGLCKPQGEQNYMNCFRKIKQLADSIKTLDNFCKAKSSRCNTLGVLPITRRQHNEVLQINDWYVKHAFLPSHVPGFKNQLPQYQQLSTQTGCPLVSEVIHNMSVKLNKGSKTDYILYSAHDTSILAVMSYLLSQHFTDNRAIPVHGNPNFAAGLSFQLYKSLFKRPQVKVIYRNSPGKSAYSQIVFEGSFDTFKKRYFNKQCLAVAKSVHRCDYL